MLYEALLRPLLFGMDPEEAHEAVTALLEASQEVPGVPALVEAVLGAPPAGPAVEAFGLRFKNPLGLAAGFDKNARLLPLLPSLGFGFVELGSVTLRPQPGNAKPRLFRVAESSALVNRLGFNSLGAAAVAKRLSELPRSSVPVGINLGLNADCPPERAAEDYAEAFKVLEPHGDYFAVNVSSPNTKGLRDLQQARSLEAILKALAAANGRKRPVLVKLSPDLAEADLPALLEPIRALAAGVIVSNTTLSREGLSGERLSLIGGLSGAPLRARSTEMIRAVSRLTAGKLPIVGVGGVFTGADAHEKLAAGATLVQLYTGLVYRGPGAAVRILRELAELRGAAR